MCGKQAQRSTAIGAAICHRAQAVNLRSGNQEEAAKPLICRAERITGEIHGPTQQTRTRCIMFSGFLLSCCYLLLHPFNWHKPNYCIKSSLLPSDTEYCVNAAAPSVKVSCTMKLFWVRVEDPRFSSLGDPPLCSRSDRIGGLGCDHDVRHFILPTYTLYISTSAFCLEKAEGWPSQGKGEAKHSPAQTFALAVLRATVYM